MAKQCCRSAHIYPRVTPRCLRPARSMPGKWRLAETGGVGGRRLTVSDAFADSASATWAAGRVYDSLPILGLTPATQLTAPALHSVRPSGRRWIWIYTTASIVSDMGYNQNVPPGRARQTSSDRRIQNL